MGSHSSRSSQRDDQSSTTVIIVFSLRTTRRGCNDPTNDTVSPNLSRSPQGSDKGSLVLDSATDLLRCVLLGWFFSTRGSRGCCQCAEITLGAATYSKIAVVTIKLVEPSTCFGRVFIVASFAKSSSEISECGGVVGLRWCVH